jgi:hypothetical protein
MNEIFEDRIKARRELWARVVDIPEEDLSGLDLDIELDFLDEPTPSGLTGPDGRARRRPTGSHRAVRTTQSTSSVRMGAGELVGAFVPTKLSRWVIPLVGSALVAILVIAGWALATGRLGGDEAGKDGRAHVRAPAAPSEVAGVAAATVSDEAGAAETAAAESAEGLELAVRTEAKEAPAKKAAAPIPSSPEPETTAERTREGTETGAGKGEPAEGKEPPAKKKEPKRTEARAKSPKAGEKTRDPAAAKALTDKGTVLFVRGRFKDAVRKFRKALRADPGHALAHRGLGMAYLRLGKKRSATASLKRYLKLAPRARDKEKVKSLIK